jgi:hypothetical protein
MTRPMSELAAPKMAASSEQSDDWCISIKTVGGGFDDDYDGESNAVTNNSTISSSGERLFRVKVSPEDGVASLYQEIEVATGVKQSQQRLIYRGRIINDHPPLNDHEEGNSLLAPKDLNNDAAVGTSTNSTVVATTSSSSINTIKTLNDPRRRKIKDIAGLCDGQTIHLVKKRENSSDSSSSPPSSTASSNDQSSTLALDATAADLLNGSNSSGVGNGGGAFLAALLGLGNLSEDGLESNGSGTASENTNVTTPSTTPSTTSSWRSSRRNRRRLPYRLSAADLEVPDPGSMEPVRQGLMTLHTLLPHSQLHREIGTSPLEANREWFRGQWLDCRDTVNQWLEATVVEILRPQDVLPLDAVAAAPRSTTPSSTQRRQPTVDADPAVSASDLEGRQRLLLEPCQPGDPLELSGDMVGYRPRSNNNGVQLLLIHYNGWPHRWDEWMYVNLFILLVSILPNAIFY